MCDIIKEIPDFCFRVDKLHLNWEGFSLNAASVEAKLEVITFNASRR